MLVLQDAFEEKFGGRAGIPQPNSTRWNSELRCVANILQKEFEATNSVFSGEGREECCFTTTQWEKLQEFHSLLVLFADATDMLQADKVQR